MENLKAGWFVIYTRPRHEKKIVKQLEHIGVSHFLPVVKTLRTWSDRRKYIDSPLFPSYVFVQLADAQSYFRTLEIDGVLYYVRSGRQIAGVSEDIIRNLQLIASNFFDSIEVSAERIQPGSHLLIKDGPFTGFCCEVIQHKGRQKLLVRIELLQRSVLIDMPVDHLMPAEPGVYN